MAEVSTIRRLDEFGEAAKKKQEEAAGRSGVAQEQRAGLISQLQQQAVGEGPSLATAQLKQAQDRTLSQQLAAASARPGGPTGLGQRALARTQAESGQALGQQAAITGLQEQQGAQQLLAQQVGQEQQLADQLTLQFLQQGFTQEQAQTQAGLQLEQIRAQERATQASAQQGLFGSGLSALGAVGAGFFTSDKNAKENISSAKASTKSFLNSLNSKTYNYKDSSTPGTAPGKRYGIIAQDLEKSEMGKSFVINTPKGKMIDVNQGFGAALAAMADLNKRLSKVEKKKG